MGIYIESIDTSVVYVVENNLSICHWLMIWKRTSISAKLQSRAMVWKIRHRLSLSTLGVSKRENERLREIYKRVGGGGEKEKEHAGLIWLELCLHV